MARVRYERLATEQPNPASRALDRMSPLAVARLMNLEDARAVRAVGRQARRHAPRRYTRWRPGHHRSAFRASAMSALELVPGAEDPADGQQAGDQETRDRRQARHRRCNY